MSESVGHINDKRFDNHEFVIKVRKVLNEVDIGNIDGDITNWNDARKEKDWLLCIHISDSFSVMESYKLGEIDSMINTSYDPEDKNEEDRFKLLHEQLSELGFDAPIWNETVQKLQHFMIVQNIGSKLKEVIQLISSYDKGIINQNFK